jgi:hypothetical protein
VQNAPNIIQDDDGCNVWKKAVKVFNERNSILLLFSRGIDIREEKRNIVTADYGHKPSVVELFSTGLLFPTIGGLMRILTLVDCTIRNLWLVDPRWPPARMFNAFSYCVHLRLRYKVVRIIK